MHDYAVFGHSRTTIGRWLGVASITLSGGVSSLIVWLQTLSGWAVFTGASLSAAAIYFILHLIFDRYAWKIPFFKVPDISGIWNVRGETLNEDGTVRYDWNAQIDIEQTWEKIAICLRTSQSSSESYTATISKKSGTNGGWVLHYSYTNNPEVDQFHELNSHKGYCEVLIDKDIGSGEANYFNSNGRRTFGKMHLSKEG